MATQHERFISDGIGFAAVRDPKFKTGLIRVRLLLEYSEEVAAAGAIFMPVLTSCCESYPDSSLFNRRLNYLYGATVGSVCRHRGGMFEFAFTSSSILSRYAIDGTDVSLETAKLLRECIFSPALEDGGFIGREFNISKLSLLAEIDGELNDKAAYAESRAAEEAYRGEPASGRWYGSREAVENMTPARAYEIYREVLNTARVEVSFSGGGDFEKEIALFKEAFAEAGSRARVNPSYLSPSPLKPEPSEVEKRIETEQANIVMIFKPDRYDPDAMLLFSWLYGETPFSKLFMNVREKLGLCYYVSSSFAEGKNTVTVSSGVAPEKVDEAKSEILNQLKAVADGDFTDGEVEKTKLALADAYRSLYGSASSLDNWYFGQLLRNSEASPSERTEYLSRVGREDIIRAAKSLRLDTVYVLTDVKGEAE